MSPLSPFAVTCGRLVAAYRAGPPAAAEAGALLAEAVAQVATAPATIEAGLFLSGEYDIANIRSHLLRRQIEVLTVAAGTPAEVLEPLARALGGDAPLPQHPAVSYEMVAQVAPVPKDPIPTASPAAAPPPLFLMGADVFADDDDRAPSAFGAEVTALTEELGSARERGAWMDALHAAQALVRLTTRVPEMDRRTVAIRARRALSRPLLVGIIEYAIRTPEEQARAAEVLQWRGGEAAELMLEAVRQTESPEPHRFLLEALARMPDAVPLLIPMLSSPRWHEARHAADVLGRQMVPEALPPLRGLLAHPEARVRGAALEALARYPAQYGTEALREGLAHPAPETRQDAARAIGRRGGGALAMPLLSAIEAERDHATWRAMLTALARIEAPESAAALSTLALRKRGFLSRGGFSLPQRLEVVAALAASPTRAARQALTKVAREAEGEVGAAARGELDRRA
ncbi:MAG TPA: HEAT repeat domain-containing protein [Gemmatimonadales bacterium]|nr:HEAT repeat domain-containing protein [Gemmatimonadales bacterium]